MDPVEAGLACGSDTAHLSLLGYPPDKQEIYLRKSLKSHVRYYRGRGAFESLGSGIEMEDGDIGFKCNFACIDPTTNIVLQRRADRNFEKPGNILCKDLNGIH